jgi:hypothetical protein
VERVTFPGIRCVKKLLRESWLVGKNVRERTLAQTLHRRLTNHPRVRPSLKQATLAGISLDLAAGKLACDRLLPCPMLRRGALSLPT